MGNRPLTELPPEVPLPLTVGEVVVARHPRTRALYDAKVLTVNRYVVINGRCMYCCSRCIGEERGGW